MRPTLATAGPLLAQMRNDERVRKCLLLGVDRTYRGHHETDVIDPKLSWALFRLTTNPGYWLTSSLAESWGAVSSLKCRCRLCWNTPGQSAVERHRHRVRRRL